MEDAHDVRNDKTTLFGMQAVEHVEGESVRAVLRVEQDHVIFPTTRNVIRQKIFAESAMRIDD